MPPTKTPLNVHERVAQAMNSVTYIQKDSKPGMRYTIVSHDNVTAKVRPALLEAGVIYYPVAMAYHQNGNRTEVQLDVRFVNITNPEDYFDVPSLGYGVDQQDKGPGKAISYAVKYALLKALGLETGDDPDATQDAKAAHISDAAEEVESWSKSVQADLAACTTTIEVETLRATEDHNIKANRKIDKAAVSTLGSLFNQAMIRVSHTATADPQLTP